MATLTSTFISSGVQPAGLRVGLVSRTVFYSAASLSSGDVIQMLKVPSGAQLIDLQVAYALTGQGSYTVGDGGSAARYIPATVGSVAAGVTRISGTTFVPYTYSVEDTIDVTLSASVNPSSGAIYMIAVLNMNP